MICSFKQIKASLTYTVHIENRQVQMLLDVPVTEVPSRVELLYTVLQTVT